MYLLECQRQKGNFIILFLLTLSSFVFALKTLGTLGVLAAQTAGNVRFPGAPNLSTADNVQSIPKQQEFTEEQNNNKKKYSHVIHISPLMQISYGLDKGFSHLTRSIFMVGGKIGYDYRSRKIQNEFVVAGSVGPSYPPYLKITDVPGTISQGNVVPAPDTAIWFDLADTFLFHFTPKKVESFWQFSLGAELAFALSTWIPPQRLNYSFFLALELKPLIRLGWQLHPRHGFWADITLPLIGIGWRPPWAGLSILLEKNLEEGGIIGALFSYPYFLFWHNNQTTRFRLSYEWQISHGFSFTAQYEHILQMNQAVQPYTIFNNRLYLGIEIKPARKSANEWIREK